MKGFQQQGLNGVFTFQVDHSESHVDKGQEWKEGDQLKGDCSFSDKGLWWLTLGLAEITTNGQIGQVFWR